MKLTTDWRIFAVLSTTLLASCAGRPATAPTPTTPSEPAWVDPTPTSTGSVSPDVSAVLQSTSEQAAWEVARVSKDVMVLDAFLGKYPQGVNQKSAELRRSLILKGAIR